MDIFVGNLSFDSTQGDVKKLFEGFGNVASAVIVMRKEKKVPKSRGFGFVQMPDEQQAFAAIAALNGKEFMGRVINVNPARPKTEDERKSGLREKRRSKVAVKIEQRPYPVLTDRRVRPIGQPGTYKGGRRTRSYIKQRGLTGIPQDTKPRARNQDNPMRWRKKKDQVKPWQKPAGDAKPWIKSNGRPQKSRLKGRKIKSA